MKTNILLLLFTFNLTLLSTTIQAQCNDCYAGSHIASHNNMDAHRIAAAINGGLRQSLLMQNVCGLNYVQATVLTETRTAANGFNFGGTGFPTTLNITGLPNLFCSSVLKAYLYYGCTYVEASPPATTVTFTNPALNSSVVSSTMVGTTFDNICWNGNGSATYRADVTSLISGNGTYTANLNGFAAPVYEVDGVTLLIIYSDATASYSGSIALYDGDLSNDAGVPETFQADSFNVCGIPSSATAFTLLADVQQNVNGGVNYETYNNTSAVFQNNFWNYDNISVKLASGQDSLVYGTYLNNASDCYFIALAGLYWQNTNCVTCIPLVTTMTVTTASSPNTCVDNGSASVSVTGAAGPLTYYWSPGGQTADTADSLAPGTYTVDITDGHTCTQDTITIANLAMVFTFTSTPQYCLTPGKATIIPSSGFPPYTYLWTPGGQTTASVTGLSAAMYTVTVTDSSGCSIPIQMFINEINDLSLNYASVVPQYACPPSLGYAVVNINSGKAPFTYLWSPGGQTTDTARGLTAGAYSFMVTDAYGCTSTYTTSVAYVASNMTINFNDSSWYYCPAYEGEAVSYVAGGTAPYSYLWSPGGQTTYKITGLTAGTYTLTVTDSNGCRDSATTIIYTEPVTFGAYTFPDTINAGDSAWLYAECAIPATYLWSNGSTTSSLYVEPVTTTSYTCTATTPCGTYMDTLTVYVNGSCTNAFDEPICIVTVDTATGKDEVIWGRTDSPPQNGFGSYRVYRDTGNGFNLADTQALNALSEYIDTIANPNARPVSYKLATFDSCGESALSPPHITIYLTTSAAFNVNILNWTAYVGFTPSVYRIFRGLALSSLVQIDSVASNILTFRDTLPPAGSIYVVEAVNPHSACIPESKAMPHRHILDVLSLTGSFSNGFNTKQLILGISKNVAAIGNLTIYPNPANGMVTIQFNVGTQEFVSLIHINIINELGQVVYDNSESGTAGAFKEQINLQNVAPGIYSIRLQTNSDILIRKLVIMGNK